MQPTEHETKNPKPATGRKFTFHLLGLVHLPTARKYTSCAFTQKNVKLAKMLVQQGHTVFLYGCRSTAEGPLEEYIFDGKYRPVSVNKFAGSCSIVDSAAGAFCFVETHNVKQIAATWGEADNRFEIGYDWTNTDFRHDFNTQKTNLYNDVCRNMVSAIKYNSKPDHFLLCTQGDYHTPVAEAVKLFLTCEPGIGYRGSVEGRYRAFESSYIQNFTYGSEHPRECINGSFYDRVIPNYFDPQDVFCEAPASQKDNKNEAPASPYDYKNYYLFIGRMIKRKGILIAALACEAVGKKLIIAGQGAKVDHRGCLVPTTDPDFELAPGNWEYVGYVDTEQRKHLMAGAIAVFTPTEYLECFAGTHIESMLAGTPPITTNFAVFAETIPDVLNGQVGYRCNTLQDFVNAALDALTRHQGPFFNRPVKTKAGIRVYAQRFLMENVAKEFEQWWQDLYSVYESATQPGVNGWSRLTASSKVEDEKPKTLEEVTTPTDYPGEPETRNQK